MAGTRRGELDSGDEGALGSLPRGPHLLVRLPIRLHKGSDPTRLPVLVLPLVLCAIHKVIGADAMLLALLPAATVAIAIGVGVDAVLRVGGTIPFAIQLLAIRVQEDAVPAAATEARLEALRVGKREEARGGPGKVSCAGFERARGAVAALCAYPLGEPFRYVPWKILPLLK